MNLKDYERFRPKLKGTPRKRNKVQLLDPRLRPNAPKEINLRKKTNVTKKTIQ